eukprot:7612073-Karenia_brevis.AAC.1
MIIAECGLKEGSTGVNTPREKRKAIEVFAAVRAEKMNKEDATRFRSIVMRAAYLSQDRGDTGEAIK